MGLFSRRRESYLFRCVIWAVHTTYNANSMCDYVDSGSVNVCNGAIQGLQQAVLKQLGLDLKSSSYPGAFWLHPEVDACVGLSLTCV